MTPLALPNEAEDDKAAQNFREIQQYLVGTEESISLAAKAADSQPAADVFNSGVQTVLSGVTAVLAFDSEALDVGSMHDNVTNNSRLTISTAGLYLIMAQAIVTAGQTTDIFQVLRNGTAILAHVIGADRQIALSDIKTLAAGEYLQAQYINATPANANVTATFKAARLSKGS